MTNEKYKIIIAKSVDEFIEKLPENEKERINKRIKKLEIDPRQFSEFRGDFWLLKVGRGGYRISYEFSEVEKLVKILAIEKRASSDYKRKFYS